MPYLAPQGVGWRWRSSRLPVMGSLSVVSGGGADCCWRVACSKAMISGDVRTGRVSASDSEVVVGAVKLQKL
jgi:hypothetical protein